MFLLLHVTVKGYAQEEAKSQLRKLSFWTEPPEAIEIVKVSGYKSENWLDDFELEIKNKSNKPIYCISFFLDIPEMKRSENFWTVVPLEFGETALRDLNKRPTDLEKSPHIQPGETITLKIQDKHKEGFKEDVKRRLQEASLFSDEVKELVLHMNMLSFGDGTGYHYRNKLGVWQ